MAVLAINQPPTPNPAPHPAPSVAPTAAAEPSAAPHLYTALLLHGEDPEAHDVIWSRITAAVRPADILEEIWVEDVVDLVWEAFRLRRFKSCLMTTAASKGVLNVLSASLPYAAAHEMATKWAAGDTERVESTLEQAGLTMEHVVAETWVERQEEMERLDRMIASAEERRNTMLREIERHRAVLASRLRCATDAIEAEFEDAPPGLAAPGGRSQ
jgi:hypothetical protein